MSASAHGEDARDAVGSGLKREDDGRPAKLSATSGAVVPDTTDEPVIIHAQPSGGETAAVAADDPTHLGELSHVRLSDTTPRLTERQERFIRGFSLAVMAYSTYWVVWRWTSTLNWAAWWFSIPLVLAETYILFQSALMVFTGWRMKHRDPKPAPRDLDVDVFITTYDEPIEIVRRTAIGARAISYPHRTYILDDGKRDELQSLAEDLGVGYIRRTDNEHAKAGNLNHALAVTSGEFILQLDADHVPLPNILDRLLGFFDDPKVAFVQSPQDFYNLDSFSYDVNDEARRVWDEQRLFFSMIQPGKDHWNASFFCGSCGVLRREALNSIGGFSTETITEDMETSLLLHANGWKSTYYGESLAYGLAPASAAAYAVQRLRWGQGSMQLLRKFNPLTYPGLTWPQRLCYLNSVSAYLDGVMKFFLYLCPIIFFMTGALAIWVDERAFLYRFIPYIVAHFVMFELLFRGTGYILIAERYNMAKFWIYTMAVSGYFAKGRLKFNVTPKGTGDVPFRTYAPQVVLIFATLGSMGYGTIAYYQGWLMFDETMGWRSLAFWFNALWAAYNLYFAWYVVRLSIAYKQQRKVERFFDTFPFRVRVLNADGATTESWMALAENLHLEGLGFRLAIELPEGTEFEATLPLTTGDTPIRGKILHREQRRGAGGAVHHYGVRFDELTVEQRDAIELHCMQHAVPMQRLRYRDGFDPFSTVIRWIYDARDDRRDRIGVPVRVYMIEDGNGRREPAEVELGYGLLDEVSPGGARLLIDEPLAPGTALRYATPRADASFRGSVVYTRALETPLGVRFAVGIRRDDKERRSIWMRRPHAAPVGV